MRCVAVFSVVVKMTIEQSVVTSVYLTVNVVDCDGVTVFFNLSDRFCNLICCSCIDLVHVSHVKYHILVLVVDFLQQSEQLAVVKKTSISRCVYGNGVVVFVAVE